MTLPEDRLTQDYRIATSVLETMVRGCLGQWDRVRLPHPHGPGLMRGRGVEVSVTDGSCRVTLPVEARFGEELHPLAQELRTEIRRCLGTMTGLEVLAVDVIFVGVFPVDDAT